MNKIFLKKSFAGYPVWEYTMDWDKYYFNIACSSWIHKDIVEWMKDYFEEVKERPTSWEKLWSIDWYWIKDDCKVDTAKRLSTRFDSNKSVFLTQQQAEASIALAQIIQLLDKYDIPEESKAWIYNSWSLYSVNTPANKRWWLLRFDTPEKRDHFYKHHADLISKLAPFYIF